MVNEDFFEIVWSEKLFEEATAEPFDTGRMSPEAYEYLWSKLVIDSHRGFVSREEIAKLEPAMPNHWKDRHVAAAAVAGDASVIVHDDRRGFRGIETLGLRAFHVNDYLRYWLDRRPAKTLAVLERVAATDFHPALTVEELLARIARARAPRFAAGARVRLLPDRPVRGVGRLRPSQRPRDESGFVALYTFVQTSAERMAAVCGKCGGTHYIERFKHIDAGRCWNCLGPPGQRKRIARRC